jgi:hypothetical protein
MRLLHLGFMLAGLTGTQFTEQAQRCELKTVRGRESRQAALARLRAGPQRPRQTGSDQPLADSSTRSAAAPVRPCSGMDAAPLVGLTHVLLLLWPTRSPFVQYV